MNEDWKEERRFPMNMANEVHRLASMGVPSEARRGGLTNEQTMTLGKLVWPHTYKLTQDDGEAYELACNWSEELVRLDPERGFAYQAALLIPHEQMRLMWASRWVDQGCPRIVCEGPFAALLMSTDTGEELAELVIPPWKSFLIEVPLGLLPCKDDRDSEPVFLRRIFVQQNVNSDGVKVWNLIAESDNGLQLWRHGVKTEELLHVDKAHLWKKEDADEFLLNFDTQDERILLLVGRLVVSLCLALSDPTLLREQKKTKGRGGRVFRASKDGPSIRTFIVGRPVSVDCRKTVRDYAEGHRVGGRVTVQFLVRGHWKNQPYGPGHSLRKIIHVEPYWKGPEDAKILTKSVNLGGSV